MPEDFVYGLTVVTEDHWGAGTDEEIFIRLIGGNDKSFGDWYLSNPKENNFEKGESDNFGLASEFLGEIKKVFIYVLANKRDPEGTNSAWHLNYVRVTAKYGGQSHAWIFPVKKWLGIPGRDQNGPINEIIYSGLEISQDGTFKSFARTDDLPLTGFEKKRVVGGAAVPQL